MMTTYKALRVSLIHQINECKKAAVLEVEGFPSVTTPSQARLLYRNPECGVTYCDSCSAWNSDKRDELYYVIVFCNTHIMH